MIDMGLIIFASAIILYVVFKMSLSPSKQDIVDNYDSELTKDDIDKL